MGAPPVSHDSRATWFGARRVHAAGAFSLAAYLLLAWLNRVDGAEVWALWGSAALVWAAMLAAASRASAVRPAAIILWAAAFHLAGLWGGPLLEDDFHRYLWDGYRFAVDGTPYGTAPASFFADASVPDSLRAHLDQINFPDLPTIYGPLTELLFAAGYFIAPGQLWPLQLLLSAISLGVMAVLARAGAPAAALLLYGWNPLVIKEIAFTAHPDILAAGFALLAWLCVRSGRMRTGGALLACACASRLVFVLIAPLILARAGIRGWLACVAIFALIYLPFLGQGITEGAVLLAFAQQWQFNAGAFALFAEAFGDGAARLLAMAVALAAVAAMIYRRGSLPDAPVPALVVAALAIPLLLGPALNAWYWIWLLPFAALSGWRVAPWIGSAVLLLSYGTYFNLGLTAIEDYTQPPWLRALEHALIWLAFVWEAPRIVRSRFARHSNAPLALRAA